MLRMKLRYFKLVSHMPFLNAPDISSFRRLGVVNRTSSVGEHSPHIFSPSSQNVEWRYVPQWLFGILHQKKLSANPLTDLSQNLSTSSHRNTPFTKQPNLGLKVGTPKKIKDTSSGSLLLDQVDFLDDGV